MIYDLFGLGVHGFPELVPEMNYRNRNYRKRIGASAPKLGRSGGPAGKKMNYRNELPHPDGGERPSGCGNSLR